MCEYCQTYNPITTYGVNSYDPTRTTMLRDAFAKDMNKRFRELSLVVVQSIVQNDCFGLSKDPISTLQMEPAGFNQFKFILDSDKVEAFMEWLQLQIDRGIIKTTDINQIGSGIQSAWTNKYILDSYKRGIIRARQEMIKQGLKVPSVEESGGIDAIMGVPFHIDRVGLLFIRAFSELRGITAEMANQIGKVLAQGMIDGDGPRLIAKKLVATINGTGMGDLAIRDTLGRYIPAKRRAEMLARTEIIRAHHQATIQEYRTWGVVGVNVKAEFRTAGDDRVCTQCSQLQGKIYTLDEAEGIIPVHPLCRCITLPYLEKT